MNRIIAPSYNPVNELKLSEPEYMQLENGIPMYFFNTGSQDVLRIEVVLNAGPRYQSAPLTAHIVNNMLNEGTKTHTAAQIAETFEYYGAYFHSETDLDNASVALYLQNKHIEKLLPLFVELLTEAIFPQNELDIYLQNAKQKYLVNKQKVNYLARHHFAHALFGKSVYGFMVEENHYDNVSREILNNFYTNYYNASNITLIVAGRVETKEQKKISELFSRINKGLSANNAPIEIPPYTPQKKYVEKKDAVQNAIRIGCRLFNKTHKDYFSFQVLNTVLGGYFGSRLMSNIREDKGYTYGIGSAIVSLEDAGYFFISTEVGADVCNAAIDEIYKELNKLIETPIPEEELVLVKNYLAGTLLRSLDGPFALAEKFKAAHTFGFDMSYYDNMLKAIQNINSADLQKLAATYLQSSEMTELVAGKM
jgi:zinc protease